MHKIKLQIERFCQYILKIELKLTADKNPHEVNTAALIIALNYNVKKT